MNYRRNNHKKRNIFLFGIVMFSALLYFWGSALAYTFATFTHSLLGGAAPVREMSANVFKPLTYFFSTHATLEKENEMLKEVAREYEVQKLIFDYTQKENKELKEIVNRGGEKKKILGVVLAKPNRSLYDTLIIDAGSAEGVALGDRVLAQGRVAIGTVAQVFPHSANIRLFSSTGVETGVLMEGSNITATAHGKNGGNFELELPRDTEVALGDYVLMPSIESQLLASVAHIQKEANDPFQTILARAPINIFELKFVEILKTE